MIELVIREARVHLRLRALFMGQDMCILLDGGQKPHIGAISSTSHSQEAFTYSLPKHKEEQLAAQVTQSLHSTFNVTVVCLCGIHIPSITREEIDLVQRLSMELVETLIPKIQFFLQEKNDF